MTHYTYLVGGHLFSLEFTREPAHLPDILKPYAPFLCQQNDTPLFHMKVEWTDSLSLPPSESLLAHFQEEDPSVWVYRMENSDYFGFSPCAGDPSPVCLVHQPHTLSENTLYLTEQMNTRSMAFCIHNALMLLYMLYTAPLNTVLIHSSVVRLHQKAYAFLGKSGTGKSTHTRLWLKNIPGTALLNDDNPIIRVYPDKIRIYGSPWSGKTPCYKNENAELGGIVRLAQAPANKISVLNKIEAYAALLPSCSSARWDTTITQAIHHTMEQIIQRISIYRLQCLPDAEAALLCKSQIEQ